MNQPERLDPIARLMDQGVRLSDSEARAARVAFMDRVEDLRSSRFAWRQRLWLAAAVAVLLFVFWPSNALRFEVEGAVNHGGYVRAAESSALLRFSDETELRAQPGARVRVAETAENGARVSLEEGTLSVHVTHTGRSDWDFEAGPFVVHVTGTRFDLHWNAGAETLQVDLFEGSVEISGYDDSGPVVLRRGQRFSGDVKNRRMEVSELVAPAEGAKSLPSSGETQKPGPGGKEQSPTEGEVERSSGVDETATKKPEVASQRNVAKPQSEAWSHLVSRGKFKDVVRLANERGAERCLAECTSADLTALSDAARYAGQDSLAARSLLALRSRFASRSGVRAAFLLGRLHEGQGQQRKALSWYETALREAPSGGYASEALAGTMRAVLALRGRAAARPIAEKYLLRYPEGVHAKAASKIAHP